MNYLGSRTLETKRLILKAQTMEEQRRLWEILMIPEVNRYFLTVPSKFRDKLKDWLKQEEFYKEEMKHATDNDVFKWSIYLKDSGKCIGRVDCHEASVEDNSITSPSIRGVGWIIDPIYQGKGYGTEAAKAMIDYMFMLCDIEMIITGAATCNPSSYKIMERLGFEKEEELKQIWYTFLDEPVDIYSYIMTKERYLKLNRRK